MGIPYYMVFDCHTDELQAFQLVGNQYQPQELVESKIWLTQPTIGGRLWQDEYRGLNRLWLRWYDVNGNWIPLEAELE